MATSILLKFLTLKWNIARTIRRIEVGDGSFFSIFHALSFTLNFFQPEVPFKTDSSVDLCKVLLKTYLTSDLLKPVQTDSAGVCLFLIPVQTDPSVDLG